MPFHKLPNYLRTHRKRASLSQDEVAFLLGCRSGAKVSRYERFRRLPGLRTAFAYEVLFGVPVRELFAGVFQKVETATVRRVQGLIRVLDRTPDRLKSRKLEALQRIGQPKDSH